LFLQLERIDYGVAENNDKLWCKLGPDRVDIFNRAANPSVCRIRVWTECRLFTCKKISYGMCEWIIGYQHSYRQPSTSYRQKTSLYRPESIWLEIPCL